MSSTAVITRDKDAVVRVWEMHEMPCFSVWENKSFPAFSCTLETPEERENFLLECLEQIRNGGSAALFTIKFHEMPKNGKITNGTPVFGSMPFRLSESQPAGNNRGGSDAQWMKELFETRLQLYDERHKQELAKKDQVIQELQEQLEEGPEDAEDLNLGVIGQVLQAGEKYPTLKRLTDMLVEFLADAVTVGKHKFKNMAHAAAPAGSGINGVEEEAAAGGAAPGSATPDQQVNAAIRTLVTYFINHYGTGATDEEKRQSGFVEFAYVMTLLANLTTDPDVMELAIKKLKQLA